MKMRVKAVPDRMIPMLGADGKIVVGAYAGIHRRTREALPDGEIVEDVGGYFARAVADGDLEKLPLGEVTT